MPNKNGTKTYLEMLEDETDASNERGIDQLAQEIERLQVKHAIYRQSPELKEVADSVAENMSHLKKMLLSKSKIFRLAKPADNITKSQEDKPRDISEALGNGPKKEGG